MLVYAGIDEAGYGPILGPLVIARSLFVLDTSGPELPDLWERLAQTVCRTTAEAKDQLVAINDSKLLYNPAVGLKTLERGVLSFLPDLPSPLTLETLLETVYDGSESGAPHRHVNHPELPWYLRPPAGLEDELPAVMAMEAIERFREAVGAALSGTGVLAHEISASLVYEDVFNRLMLETGNKSSVSWSFVAAHLLSVWNRYGEHYPRVIVDRQSGRKDYGTLLADLFPGARISVTRELSRESHYEVERAGRGMQIAFLVQADALHLPTALAAMTAKYMRELLMRRFQSYWLGIAPEVRPTAGYFGDGRRFLAEIEPFAAALGITPQELFRVR